MLGGRCIPTCDWIPDHKAKVLVGQGKKVHTHLLSEVSPSPRAHRKDVEFGAKEPWKECNSYHWRESVGHHRGDRRVHRTKKMDRHLPTIIIILDNSKMSIGHKARK